MQLKHNCLAAREKGKGCMFKTDSQQDATKAELKQFSPSWLFLYLNASELGAKKACLLL